MFGRQIFVEPMDGTRIQRRRDTLRHIAVNQRHGVPCTELASIPSLRNDGLLHALNFILIEDDDRIQTNNNIYLRTNCGNTPNRHMLHYIRQMEERYIAMERELTRAKMLIPRVTRNTNPVHHTVQTDINWKGRALAKYGSLFGTFMGNQYRRNRAQMNVSSRRKHSVKRCKDFSQSLQNDIYPIKESCDDACQSKMLNGETTTVCPLQNISITLPQDTKQLSDLSEQKQSNSKENNDVRGTVDKSDSAKGIFDNSGKYGDTFETQKFATSMSSDDDEKLSMEVCQRFGKKYEPETSYHSGFDVNRKGRAQTKSDMDAPEFQSIIRAKFDNDIFDRKPQFEQPTYHRHEPNTNSDKKCLSKRTKLFENTDIRQNVSHPSQQYQSKRNYCNNNSAKNIAYERTRCANDSNHSSRMVQKQRKDACQRGPTPRSNVHTAYTPMSQSSFCNSVLDPNVLSIQLLRLAVLLYAPALIPALNLLIARQTVLTSIPVPCSEGPNDFLSQILTILSNQQNVPNLRYAQNSGTDESSQSQRESNWQNSSSHRYSSPQNVSKQLRDAETSIFQKAVVNRQFEKKSIAVNTSWELCRCNDTKQSSTGTAYDQIEGTEKLVYVQWTNQKSKLSESMMQLGQEQGKVSRTKNENECSPLIIDAEADFWKQAQIKNACI